MSVYELPPDLPRPENDGATAHLFGMMLPKLALPCTRGDEVLLTTLDRTVLFFYPRTGVPDEPPLLGFAGETWESIPGARGCTPQSCGFRDAHEDFRRLGVAVFGVSTQDTAFQRAFKERNHVPFDYLSDVELRLVDALRLPTFEFPVSSGGPTTLVRRMALYIERGVIARVFYPVFPPNENAKTVLAWLVKR